MLAQTINPSQDFPLSPPVSVSEVYHSEKAMSAPANNSMKLVSFADLLDEQLVSLSCDAFSLPSLTACL
jgi:hypothetical protein